MKCGGISMCKKYEHKEMSLILNKTDWGGGGEDRFSFEFIIFIAHKHVKKQGDML